MRLCQRIPGYSCSLILLGLLLGSLPSPAKTVTLLHSFTGGNDGSYPGSTLIRDQAGNLYGTTSTGGGNSNFGFGSGTVFQLSPNADGKWTETILYSFAGGADGKNPNGTLLLDAEGNLYGTTISGGSHGVGTVYKLTAPSSLAGTWVQSVLYSFGGGNTGASPYGGVIADSKGNLFGTTSGDCCHNSGTIFELSHGPSGWTQKVLYRFHFLSGEGPYCNLVMDKKGNLYGTTFRGGANDGGTVFELSPVAGGWGVRFIHDFANFLSGNGDGSEPVAGLIIDGSGILYGTTLGGGIYGGGTVFELNETSNVWQENVIHSFAGGSDGSIPYGVLAFGAGNSLFGTTEFGGGLGQCFDPAPAYCGTIFKLVPNGSAWNESIYLSFDDKGTLGFTPTTGVLVSAGGKVFATPEVGGINETGTLIEIAP